MDDRYEPPRQAPPEPRPPGQWPAAAEPTPTRWQPRPLPSPAANLALFLATLLTTAYWGFLEYQNFYHHLDAVTLNPLRAPEAWLGGLPFGLAVIAFLLAHELGHYLACRYYGIAATLPYFIPMPPLLSLLPGSMGAVIRIVGPIRSRRALFDVAVAGPLAGFAVALPILVAGLSQSRAVDLTALEGGLYLQMGEPLIWGPLQDRFAPPLTEGQDLLVHPLAFVGWFAMLVTAMNLLPVGQLDGGHLLYAFLPRAHRGVSLAILGLMLVAGILYFSGWLVFALVVALILGTRHPRPQRFEEPLGPVRVLLGLAAATIFASSFILVPVRLPALLG